jgi:putative ABC transport system permease protein
MIADFKYALRQLLKSPGFTTLAVTALALGIGANTAIFSAVDSLFLRPLAFRDSARLVRVANSMLDRGLAETSVAYPRYLQTVEQQRSFGGILASANTGLTLSGRGEPVRLAANRVTANFLEVLGLKPWLGRGFAPADDHEGAAAVAMLSYGYWQSAFGGDPGLLGKSLTLDGVATTVVGILPPGVDTPFDQTQVFVPRVFDLAGFPRELIEKGSGYLFLVGRLKPGASIASADEELRVLSARYRQANSSKVDSTGALFCVDLREDLVGNQRPTFLVLLATVGFVLVNACANVANLLLARFSQRRKEVAVRSALGASRGRIVRQFLVESVLTSAIAGALGLLIARWGIVVLERIETASANAIPRLQSISLDTPVLLFAIAVALGSGIALGIVPALSASRGDASEALKESARGSTGGRSVGRLRSTLLITEVALSLVLLVGAALLLDSFHRLQRVNVGFEPGRAVLANVSLPDSGYGTLERKAEFYRQTVERLGTIPGIERAGGTDDVPLSGNLVLAPYAIEGRSIPAMDARPLASRPTVTPGYFAAMGVPVVAGRDFTWRDGPAAAKVIIINQTLAHRLFPNENPIGRRLITGILSTPREIVGVVGDIRSRAVGQDALEEMYYPTSQVGSAFFSLIVRTRLPAASLRAEMLAALHTVDPQLPMGGPQSLSEILAQSIAAPQLAMGLLSGFAGLSLLLAGMGIYTVIAFVVTQRTSEIGIRMALGADPRTVFVMVMRQGMTLALTGLVIGLAAALAMGQLVSGLLYEVHAYDPWVLGGVSLFLAAVAALACAVPAWRAIRIDPVQALRGA